MRRKQIVISTVALTAAMASAFTIACYLNSRKYQEAANFSSRQLLVSMADQSEINDSHVVSSYAGVYHLVYDTENDAKKAYQEFVDNGVAAIDTNGVLTDADKRRTSVRPSFENSYDPLDEVSSLEFKELDNADKKKIIAVIDTGVSKDIDVAAIYSVTGGDGYDNNGHGTKMIEAIKEQNSDAEIISIQALDDHGRGNSASVFAGIEVAANSGADIIELPVSTRDLYGSRIMQSVIEAAVKKGITVVGAAGEGDIEASYTMPGSVSHAIITGSCDADGKKTWNSNYGQTVDYLVVSDNTAEASAKMAGYLSCHDQISADGKLIYVHDGKSGKIQQADDAMTPIAIMPNLYADGLKKGDRISFNAEVYASVSNRVKEASEKYGKLSDGCQSSFILPNDVAGYDFTVQNSATGSSTFGLSGKTDSDENVAMIAIVKDINEGYVTLAFMSDDGQYTAEYQFQVFTGQGSLTLKSTPRSSADVSVSSESSATGVSSSEANVSVTSSDVSSAASIERSSNAVTVLNKYGSDYRVTVNSNGTVTKSGTDMSSDNDIHDAYVAYTSDEAEKFDTKRLLVETDKKNLRNKDIVTAQYDGVYLLQYQSVGETKAAYQYYETKNVKVETDNKFYIAGTSMMPGNLITIMTADSNPISELKDNLKKNNVDNSGKIAVIDTGAATDKHTTLVSMLGDNGADVNGHGTQIVKEIRSIAPDAEILSIKALDNNGQGTSSSIYAALKYAISQNVSIINMSFSGYQNEDTSIVKEAIQEAVNAGITVVGAAGNNGSDASQFIPANISDAIIVSACNKNGVRLGSSNYGETVDYAVYADSTSVAAARMSGYLYMNNGEITGLNSNGMIFSTDYVSDNNKVENTQDNNIKETDVLDTTKLCHVKYLFVDKDYVGSGSTIDAITAGNMQEILFQAESYVPVYKTTDGKYKAVTDAPYQNGFAKGNVLDYAFAKDNTYGEIITKGVNYNVKTNTATFTEDAFNQTDDSTILMQLLVPASLSDADASVPVSIEDETGKILGKSNLPQYGYDNLFFSIGKGIGINKSDISIYVNGVEIGDDDFSYDEETGSIYVYMLAAQCSDINVVLSGKRTGTFTVAYADDGTYPQNAIVYLGNDTDPDWYSVGLWTKFTLRFSPFNMSQDPAPIGGEKEITLGKVYHDHNENTDTTYDWVTKEGRTSVLGLPTTLFDHPFQFYHEDGSSYGTWETGYNHGINGFCIHIAKSIGIGKGNYRAAYIKVIGKQDMGNAVKVTFAVETEQGITGGTMTTVQAAGMTFSAMIKKQDPPGVRIIKKDNSGSPVAGAKFIITCDGKEIWNNYTDATGRSDATLDKQYIGKQVTVSEAQAPTGYKKAPDQTIVLSAGWNPLYFIDTKIVTYPGNPTLIITKMDSSGSRLSGAGFTAYCDGKAIWSATTDSSGTISKKLDSSYTGKTVTVKETTVPKGYTAAPDQTVTLHEGSNELTFTDNKIPDAYGTLSVEKIPDGNAGDLRSIEGAVYYVYDSRGNHVQTLTTRFDGTTNVVNLKVGTYTVKEIKAPTGYTLDPTVHTVTITDKKSHVIVTSYEASAKHGHIVIKKKDAESGVLLSGACFTIYKNYVSESNEIDSFFEDPDNPGTYTSPEIYENLAGTTTFVVKETRAPFGHIANFERTFTLDQAGTEISYVATNKKTPQWVYINKVDEETGDVLRGATIKIAEYNINTKSYDKPSITMAWDEGAMKYKALIKYTASNAGRFRVVETKAPDKYLLMNDFDIEIPQATNVSSYEFTCTDPQVRQLCKVVVKKQDAETGTSLKDAVFSLYEWNEKMGTYEDTALCRLQYNEKTQCYESPQLTMYDKAADLKIYGHYNNGKFRLVETHQPDGYIDTQFTKDLQFTHTDDELTEEVNPIGDTGYGGAIVITNQPNKVHLYKKYANGNAVSGAKFKVGRLDTSATDDKEYTTDSNGCISLDRLASGEYRYYETEAPEGYWTDSTMRTFYVDSDGRINGKSEESFTVVNYAEYPLTITKKTDTGETSDTKTGFPNGTVFTVYEYSKATGGYKKNAYCQISNNNGEFIDFTTMKKAVLKYTEDNEGKFRVQETHSTDGYVMDETPQDVTIPAVYDSSKSCNLTFVNKANSFTIQKLDDNKKSLEGTHFILYRKGHEAETPEYNDLVTDSNGKITVTGLAPGTWYYRETKTLKGLAIDSTQYQFVVDDNSNIDGKDTKQVVITNSRDTILRLLKHTDDATATFPEGTEFYVYAYDSSTGTYKNTPYMTLIYHKGKLEEKTES